MNSLWPLKPATKLCTDFYVFDTETGIRAKDGYIYWHLNAQPKSFVFGVIYGYNYTKVIHTIKEFKDTLLESRFKNRKVFAHNLQYDINTIYGNVFDLDLHAIFNNKLICATNGNCIFADSANVFVNSSVERIGKMLGLYKGKLGGPGYRTKVNKEMLGGIPAKDINYCIRDCQIVYDALLSVFEFAGDIKVTQASLSMTYYRRYHQPFRIDYNDNVKYFWLSYYGGRTEAFKLGKTHAKVIDVNSMYPYCMRNIKFPNPKLLKHENGISIKRFNKYLSWYEGCANLTIFHKESRFGFLPYKENGKLLFPNGRFSGWWNFNEIRFAIKKGFIEVEKVNSVIYAEPLESPFVSYVDTLMGLKSQAEIEGNEFNRDRSKRFANSLYGKFAQKITEESIYIHDVEKEYDFIREKQLTGEYIRLSMFNKNRNDAMLYISSNKGLKISHSIPSFASYITSAARVVLLEKMLTMENCGVVYCDTDSIFFELDINVKSEFHLGGWKVENKIITDIKGLKNYKFIEDKGKEVWRVKGVPVNKGKLLSIYNDDGTLNKEVPFVEQISDSRFRYFNLVKSKEALRRNIEPGAITERIKEIKNKYDKRIILSGGETKPVII